MVIALQTIGKVGCVEETLNEILSDPSFQEGVAWSRQRFRDRQTLVKEGEDGTSLFYIEAGSLRVSGHVNLERNRHLQPGFCDLHAGDIFGEICLDQTHQRTATVTAISEGCVLKLDGDRLNVFLDDHPQLGYLFYKHLFGILIERMKSANHRIENLLAWGLKAHGIEQHL